MTELSDYPPGVQDLLRWAKFHLEELDKLELEFRAWQTTQETSCIETAPMLLSRAEQARLRWEAKARATTVLQKEI